MNPLRTSYFEALAAAVRAVGTSAFHERLLDAVKLTARWDYALVVRYARDARPEMLVTKDIPAEVVELYQSGFFRFDPFYRYWREHGHGGVQTLRTATTPAERETDYFTRFLPASGIVDDLAVYLPSGDGASIALFLESRRGRFPKAAVDWLEETYPLVLALHEAHLAASPVRADRAAGPTEPAPPGLDFEAVFQAFAAGTMTPRERDIARLILLGYPTSAIAKALKIGAGTIKNHRRRLYDKLDITTERELFTQFLAHLARMPA